MALATASPFASFDINAQTNILDISSVLSEALLLDFDFLNQGITVALDDPVTDTTFYWNQEALNANSGTTSASATSVATSLTMTTGHGARFAIGDLIYDNAINSTEILQITDISTDTLTVTRGYNSTAQVSIASGATLVRMNSMQEGTDIGSDKTVKPTALSNYTMIQTAGDLLISGSQLAREMATIALDVDRQLANRAKELRRLWTTACLYSEKSSNAGSDTVYRTMLGMRNWIRDTSGAIAVDSTSEATGLSDLNSNNKSIVDAGLYADTLLIGTDLVGSIANISSANRRLMESDTHAGFTVNVVTLNQGNDVKVIVDARVKTGDYFLYRKDQLRLRPLRGRAFFVIAATDFVDGVKRRLLSEMGLEMRYPEAAVYARNKT